MPAFVTAPSERRRRTWLAAFALAALATPACFRLVGPEDPEPVGSPKLVPVRIEYRQPVGCTGAPQVCAGPVIFFATWKQEGGEFALQRVGDTNLWVGVAEAVPVNFPPRDDPYAVRVFDPFLVGDALRGITANRLTVGGEMLLRFANVGEEDESALVYIDEEGRGHNPY